ncbi:MAG: ARMT1-like domain-containing protein [Phycisphaerae bacterium]
MSHFSLLRDPEAYRPTDWNLLEDDAGRKHWLDHFEVQFVNTLENAVKQYGKAAAPQIEQARADFAQAISRLREDPAGLNNNGQLTVLDLDYVREKILHSHGLHDPYLKTKQQANFSALEAYPEVVRELHALPNDEKWLYLFESVLTGNMFDLGSKTTMHLQGTAEEFFDMMDELKERPWLIDDFDHVEAALLDGPPAKWSKVVMFVDNAGPDFVLGVMPLARELSLIGTQVVLAANENAALNDMTVDETTDMVRRIAAVDPDLEAMIEARMFEVASTGTGVPLLDLRNVSNELNEAAEDADLVAFIGMGRALESNFDVDLNVDTLHLAIIKDPMVAQRYGGQPYDCVIRYRPVDTA